MFQVSGHNGIEFKQAFTFNQLLVQNRVKITLCNDITMFFIILIFARKYYRLQYNDACLLKTFFEECMYFCIATPEL